MDQLLSFWYFGLWFLLLTGYIKVFLWGRTKIEDKWIRELKNSRNVEYSVEIRKNVRKSRRISIPVYYLTNLFLIFLFQMVWNAFFCADTPIEYVLYLIIFSVVCITYDMLYSTKLNLFSKFSFTLIDDVNKTLPYVLYLRGFDSDEYKTALYYKGESEREKLEQFSEFIFAKELRQHGISFYAVGMTKELTPAAGADRVYLSDNKWKEGVYALMKYAKHIVILINNRESCLWEIIQSKEFLNKTTFIIDNFDYYAEAREQIADTMALPQLSETDHLVCFNIEDADYFVKKEYPRNSHGCKEIANDIITNYNKRN